MTLKQVHAQKHEELQDLLRDYSALKLEHDERIKAHDALKGQHVEVQDVARMKEKELQQMVDELNTLRDEHEALRSQHPSLEEASSLDSEELASKEFEEMKRLHAKVASDQRNHGEEDGGWACWGWPARSSNVEGVLMAENVAK
jgi:sulfatase maturation enzyme AslB (radical SAM superfamily)